ncbi:DHHC palmitoyltransferase-domain-containing protein [Phascolomyces articulosus]|uniref:Palmitoyltransferase n=1 Tax=Phascolomyces articulosus TaxID=60185 RepID=A0AAD5JRV6_9FUNG|nr:DHHC palmitoyltransferase-domain-containing protein [Phascolomyces articulosus]
MLERTANRILAVGGHPFRICCKHPNEQHRNHNTEELQQQQQGLHHSTRRNDNKEEEEERETSAIGCCKTDSPMYSRCWPFLFLFSAITDFPLPLPSDKKPGQHRDWGWMPVLVVLSITAFLYYGYLDQVCLTLIHLGAHVQATIYLVPLHLWLILLLTSYARVVMKEPGTPRKAMMVMMERTDMILQTKPPYKSILPQRWCETCQWWKPDRAHHCRVCDTCVLRMDHHCPWVNGCVGFANYRYFIQFICYTSGIAAWVFTTSLAAFIMGNGLATYHGIVIAIIILSGLIMTSIGIFACSHLWLLTLNRTTIENIQYRSWASKNKIKSTSPPSMFTSSGKCIFNQGTRTNWIEMMGDRCLYWFLPLSVKLNCNGYEFNYNENVYREYGTLPSE